MYVCIFASRALTALNFSLVSFKHFMNQLDIWQVQYKFHGLVSLNEQNFYQ